MKLSNASTSLLVGVILCPMAFGQGTVLSYVPLKTVTAKAGGTAETALSLKLDANYHVNSNTPSGAYLIPMRLTWNQGPLETVEILFPPPRTEKFGFSNMPLSVFAGEFSVVTRFRVAKTASLGIGVLNGKLRYQACNDRMCLAPKSIEVTLPIEIVK